MKKMLLTVLMVALTGNGGAARAGEKNAGPRQAHLGLGVEAVPQAIYTHMPGVLAKGQGVLVDQVVKDSAAAKAGLRPNDILLSYGDQKLSSPEQLVKLVRGDKPGHQVSLNFLRGGKAMTCKVTLGDGESSSTAQNQNQRVFRLRPDEGLNEVFEEFESKHGSTWDAFDEIKLSRVDDKHWKASVQYRNKEGKKVSRAYSGTRDEIRKEIRAEKDLPASEQAQLLRAFNLHEPIFEFHFPQLGIMPPDLLERP